MLRQKNKYFPRSAINFRFDKSFCIYCRLSKGEELSNPHSEPTTSKNATVVSSPPYPEPHPSSPLPLAIPPPPPPRNPGMASMQYSLPSVQGRSSQKSSIKSLIVASLSGTLGIVEAVNQHSLTTLTGRSSQNKCSQSHPNKIKLALIIAVLTLVIITVSAVYTSVIKQKTDIPNINTASVINQKTEIPNINTSVLTQMTNISTEIPDINTSVLTQMTKVPTEIPDINTSVLTQRTQVTTEIADINTSVLTQRTEVTTERADINTSVHTQRTEIPTSNSHLTSFGM